MPVNANKPERWKSDIAQSVDLYNNWFLQFAPETYRKTRVETTKQVENVLPGLRDSRIFHLLSYSNIHLFYLRFV